MEIPNHSENRSLFRPVILNCLSFDLQHAFRFVMQYNRWSVLIAG